MEYRRAIELVSPEEDKPVQLREVSTLVECGGHDVTVPRSVAKYLFPRLSARNRCARCLNYFSEDDNNFRFDCYFHPSVHLDEKPSEPCCDKTKVRLGCHRSDHSDHYTWSLDCENDNAMYVAVPCALMRTLRVRDDHVEVRINSFADEATPVSLKGLPAPVVPASIKRWAVFNDATRYEEDRVDIYTEVIKVFNAYVIVRRCQL